MKFIFSLCVIAQLTSAAFGQTPGQLNKEEFWWKQMTVKGGAVVPNPIAPIGGSTCGTDDMEVRGFPALCQYKCQPGFHGDGPFCTQNVPAGWVDCGDGIAKSSASCAAIIASQALSTSMFVGTIIAPEVVKVVSGGTQAAKAAKLGPDGLVAAEKIAKEGTPLLTKAFNLAVAAYGKVTSVKGAITDAVDGAISPANRYALKEAIFATTTGGVFALDPAVYDGVSTGRVLDIDFARYIFDITSIVDPTGASAVIASFMYPTLGDMNDPPSSTPPPPPPVPPVVAFDYTRTVPYVLSIQGYAFVVRGQPGITGVTVSVDRGMSAMSVIPSLTGKGVVARLGGSPYTPTIVPPGQAKFNQPTSVCSLFPGTPNCAIAGFNYQFDVTGLARGFHTFTVTATNGITQTTSAPQLFYVDPPLILLEFGTDGATLPAGVQAFTLNGWAVPPERAGSPIARVVFTLDGNPLGANATYGLPRPDACSQFVSSSTPAGRLGCPNVGYTFTLDVHNLLAGPHVVTAQAFGNNGVSSEIAVFHFSKPNVTQLSVDSVTPVSDSILDRTATYPPAGADGLTVPQGKKIKVTGSARDSSGVLVVVDGAKRSFNANFGTPRPDVCTANQGGGCPNVGWDYTIDTTTLPMGKHSFVVTTQPTARNIQFAASTQKFNVASATPYISMDSFQDGVTVQQGMPIRVSGWAIDLVGQTGIKKVAIAVDGQDAGYAPYGGAVPAACAGPDDRIFMPGCPNIGFLGYFDTGKLSAGPHSFTLQALGGGSGKSPVVGAKFNVQAGVPLLSVDLADGAAANKGTKIAVTGSAIDLLGTITKVAIAVDGKDAGGATYGGLRTECPSPFLHQCPLVGFTYQMDTSSLAAGAHNLTVNALGSTGTQSGPVTRKFTVK